MSERRFAQIAVLAQLGRAGGLFTYRLPDALLPLAGPGSLVKVPFTNRQFQGVICSLEATCELPHVRDVEELLDPVPVVTPHQLRLAAWIADYYAAPMSDVLAAMLPPGLGRKTVYVLEPGEDASRSRLTPPQRLILDKVSAGGRMALDELQRQLPEIDVERAVRSLVARRLLLRISELAPPRVKMRRERVVSVTKEGGEALARGEDLHRAPRQRQLLELLTARGSIASAEISRLVPGTHRALGTLRARGLVQVEEHEMRRTARVPGAMGEYPITHPLRMSGAQQRACAAIVQWLRQIDSGTSRVPGSGLFLLHGVTGSGKTEVYLQAAAEVIRIGRQVVMMVPEISLTPQAVERVAGRFPGRVAVLHSRLSDVERLEEWQRIRHGDVDIVVGPRSALFAPLPHPGLVVVDEEHDASYKQDSSPRYHARDCAAVLGRLTGATVVLGSATPDVGTYHAACSGRVSLLELPERPVWERAVSFEQRALSNAAPRPSQLTTHNSRPLPPVEIVDMRQELKSGNRGMFSEALLTALNETLRHNHQALLFLNRRGNATVVLCRDCGFVVRCPNCDIPSTYHHVKSRGYAVSPRLICHRCDKRAVSPRACPACRSVRIRFLGVGTQKVEEEVARLFPGARVLRWDRDVTGGKEAHEQILRAFTRHEADILVGTQMIAKGLDFPLVTLVGVISADTGLHMPDFRAPERSFQLLTQVAGRAGRASLPSKVVVQTYTPEHYAVQAAQHHDYHRFYREEMSFRGSAGYPPFARLVRLVYSNEDESRCRQGATNLRSILDRAIAEQEAVGVEIIGPAPCFVSRMKNRYYWQVIARGPASGAKQLHALLDYVPPGWTIDVDPVDLL
jgi:primosomal protein N' (replication factor Y)